MTRIPLYHLDAFSDRPFGGNPAAVCVVSDWPADSLMQQIAAENNLSETAFVRPAGEGFDLRWFSPAQEVHLCGHATLAAAFVVLTRLHPDRRAVRFETCSGPLDVHLDDSALFHLALPAHRPAPVADPPADLLDGLGAAAEMVLHAVKNFYVVLRDETAVRELQPDMDRLRRLHPDGVSVTAPGSTTDFVSRYFAPSYGIPEDPVSGHPHCALVPFWAGRLGRDHLRARQLSARSGDLDCELQGDRVVVAGHVTLYAAGEISIAGPEEASTAIPRSTTSDAHPVPA
jgi:PhzF family phenazine biosynthesis protein